MNESFPDPVALLLSLVFFVAVWGCNEPTDPPSEPLPDVLLVVEDTVRPDALSTYGSARRTSPQLDAIAEAGVVFEDVTAQGSWTWPVHGSLFTGLYPWEHGAHYSPPTPGVSYKLDPMPFVVTMLRDEVPTLAERFGAAGYRTVSLSANVLIGPDLPAMVRGFEVSKSFSNDDSAVVEAALGVLSEADPRPLFLFVNLFGAHGPYKAQPASWLQDRAAELTPETAPEWVRPFLMTDGPGIDLHRRASPSGQPGTSAFVAGELEIPPAGLALLRDLYDSEVLRVDHHLNRILVAWNSSGRSGGIVSVTADHGEYFGEHGLLVHGRTLYPEVVQVPLVLAAPGRLPGGERVALPVEQRALGNTLLQLAGVETGTTPLLEAMNGVGTETIRSVAWPDVYWANAIGGQFSRGYITERRGDTVVQADSEGTISVYDLAADPGMTAPVPEEDPRHAAAWPVSFPDQVELSTTIVDPALREQLEALGYVAPAP